MSSALSCILVEITASWPLLQVSGTIWKKVLIIKMRILNQNTYSQIIFSPSTSTRDENVTSWCYLKHVVKSLVTDMSRWRPQTSVKWKILFRWKTQDNDVWFLDGPFQYPVFCPPKTNKNPKVFWWLLQCNVG